MSVFLLLCFSKRATVIGWENIHFSMVTCLCTECGACLRISQLPAEAGALKSPFESRSSLPLVTADFGLQSGPGQLILVLDQLLTLNYWCFLVNRWLQMVPD